MKTYLLLLTLFMSGMGIAQEGTVSWSQNDPLQWTDFIAQPDPKNEHAAATYSGVRYSFKYSTKPLKLHFTVNAYFDPRKSWKKQGSSTDELLKHEQLHFDIAELHARKLRKAFAEHRFGPNFEAKIKQIYAENNSSRRSMQKRYDDETDHGKRREAQVAWDRRILRALNSLKEYSQPEVSPAR